MHQNVRIRRLNAIAMNNKEATWLNIEVDCQTETPKGQVSCNVVGGLVTLSQKFMSKPDFICT